VKSAGKSASVVEGGRCCSLFLHRLVLVASCCSLLACLLGVSLVSRVSYLVCERASFLHHLVGLSSLELGASLCRCERERLKRKRWETVLLIVMLESSSRLAPSKQAVPMACSTNREAWCSTIVEVSCSSQTAGIIECKYSRVMMMAPRWCPSSASMATDQASSTFHGALRSITIMIASSSLIVIIIEYNHGH